MLQALWSGPSLRRLDAKALPDLPWLMEVAGAGLANHCLRRARTLGLRKMLFWVGPGNNGGDGLVAYRHAAQCGLQPQLWAPLGLPTAGDAASALKQLEAAGQPLAMAEQPFPDGALIVDCLFGTGLARPLDGVIAEAAEGSAARRQRVVACDLPSGLNGDTGRAAGAVVSADLTVTFGGLKPGFYCNDGVDRVGAVELVTIGFRSDHLSTEEPVAWLDERSVQHFLPSVAASAHKGRFGRVLVFAGSRGLEGAALLALTGVRVGGAGLLHLWSPELSRSDLPQLPPEAMLAPFEAHALEAAARCDAIVAGPGMGRSSQARDHLLRLIEAAPEAKIVLDADALWHLADRPFALPERCILTPHEGEAMRLVGRTAWDGDRIDLAKAIHQRFGRPVLLKGAGNLICDGRTLLIPGHARALARGGSGDVLAGLIAAIAGRGADVVEAAQLALRLQLMAGQLFADGSGDVVSQGELAKAMAEAWSEAMGR